MSEATPGAAPVSAVEPIAVNSGDSSPISFDDLETVHNQSKQAKRSVDMDTKKVVKETVKQMEKGKDEKETEVKDPTKDATKEAPKNPVEAKETKKSPLKGKLGEKDIDLDTDTMVPVTVGGKEEMLSLKELRNHYAGKVEWDKRFSKLDTDKRTFEGKISQANAQIKSIVGEKDAEIRLLRMAQFAGKDPVETARQWMDSNLKLLEKYQGMTDDERNGYFRDFENKSLKSQIESDRSERTRQQALGELNTKFQTLGKTHQIEPKQFQSRYDELNTLKKEGKFQGKITPDFIAESIVKDRLWESAAPLLETKSEWTPEQRGQRLMDLVEMAYAQGLGPQKVQEIAKELWGAAPQESAIEEKVRQKEELKGSRASQKAAGNPLKTSIDFFDEL